MEEEEEFAEGGLGLSWKAGWGYAIQYRVRVNFWLEVASGIFFWSMYTGMALELMQ